MAKSKLKLYRGFIKSEPTAKSIINAWERILFPSNEPAVTWLRVSPFRAPQSGSLQSACVWRHGRI